MSSPRASNGGYAALLRGGTRPIAELPRMFDDDLAESGPNAAERLLATLAQLCKDARLHDELWVLTLGSPELAVVDEWQNGATEYCLNIHVPADVLARLGRKRKDLATKIYSIADPIAHFGVDEHLRFISIIGTTIPINDDKEWRLAFQAYLSGRGITNQGRVNSTNIAPREHDGLLFRSMPEIYFYDALKATGCVFAPLPVFLKRDRSRVEPDFLVFQNGVTIVEIDGPWHKETPVDAQRRLQDFYDETVYVERFRAEECETPDLAKQSVRKLAQRIAARTRRP